jgi:tetratricopeptide (TPR) repeat protein
MTMRVFLFFLLVVLISCKNPRSGNKTIGPEFTTQAQGKMCSESTSDIMWYTAQSKAPLLEGLNAINYPITTDNSEAQTYFNQGLMLAYAFNHAEAARSFFEAARIDPQCAMCHWGFAYVLGPNYNAGMEPDNFERAYISAQKAKELSTKSNEKEKALINALISRYEFPAPEDRYHLDMAYSKAMKNVHQEFPDDAEIATLYAESLMNLHPWDLYDKDGNAKEWTPEILDALQVVLAINPKHPGAHHFYIHGVEASSNPQQGYLSAKIFDDGLVPGSGHLIHMPSHIYIRTGDYAKGLSANIAAIRIDSSYLSQCHAQGAYPLAYYPHNMHFIAANALYAGNSYWAAVGANQVSDHAHRKLMQEPGWGTLQHYYAMPFYITVKFGRWDDILAMTNHFPHLKYPQAIAHFARGMAFLGKKDLPAVHAELTKLKAYANDETLKDVTIWDINNAHQLVNIAHHVLLGEYLTRQKNYDQAITELKAALLLEDDLQYQEPTDWLLPVRHYLGALLLEAGQASEAVKVYQEDLSKIPKNGWALQGLKQAYHASGDSEKANELKNQIANANDLADVKIEASIIW